MAKKPKKRAIEAWAGLKDKEEKMVVFMRVVMRMSFNEIGEILQISRQGARQRFIAIMQKMMSEMYGE